jgi:hypothetical protein
LQARPPAIDVEVLEIHVQGETTVVPRTPNFSIDCDIFLRVKLTLREMRPIEILEYELSAAFRGNSLHADFLDDVPNWGLVTERQPIGIGTTFRYIVSKLPPLVRKLDSAGVPVEGWLHFQVNGVPEKDIGAAIHRLNVVTPTGAVSTDIRDLAGVESGEFHRLPYASCAKGLVSK